MKHPDMKPVCDSAPISSEAQQAIDREVEIEMRRAPETRVAQVRRASELGCKWQVARREGPRAELDALHAAVTDAKYTGRIDRAVAARLEWILADAKAGHLFEALKPRRNRKSYSVEEQAEAAMLLVYIDLPDCPSDASIF
jgi:hypothetical protein